MKREYEIKQWSNGMGSADYQGKFYASRRGAFGWEYLHTDGTWNDSAGRDARFDTAEEIHHVASGALPYITTDDALHAMRILYKYYNRPGIGIPMKMMSLLGKEFSEALKSDVVCK